MRTRARQGASGRIVVRPVTPNRWGDLVQLFGERGAYGGCWCMYFRASQAEFSRGARDRGRGNRRAMSRLVADRRIPGLLAYLEGGPVGWVSVAPREQFPRVERSPTTRPIDDRPAWSIVCFYIHRNHRREGVGTALLRAAVEHARKHGARLIEGYPVDPAKGRVPNPEAYYGLLPMFEAAGFREVDRRSEWRPIVRRIVRPSR